MCIVGDDDVDRKYMIERGEKFTWNYTASSVRRKIFLITIVNYVYNAEIHTNISHASKQQSISILYAICAFGAEHLQESWANVGRCRLWFQKEYRRTAHSDNNRQRGLHPPIFFEIWDVAAKNRIEQVCYVLDVVIAKAGLPSTLLCIGTVKTTALYHNLLYQCCYSWKRLVLFQSNIGNRGDISLLYPCNILWI